MKKLLAFILSAIIACCGVTALSADEDEFQFNLNKDEIKSIYFSTSSSRWTVSPYKFFGHTTENKEEIENICDILNSFGFVEGDSQTESDDKLIYDIVITNTDGEKTELSFNGVLTCGDNEYGVKSADFSLLREYVYSIVDEEYYPDFDSDKITSIEFTAGGGPSWYPPEIYAQYHFDYKATAKNEIDYICHALNSFKFKLTGHWGFTMDATDYTVRITDVDGNETYWFFDSKWLTYDNKSYEADYEDFAIFSKYIYGIKKGALTLAEDITEVSDWAEKDINTAISEGLLPELYRTNYFGNISRIETCQLLNNLLAQKNVNQERNYTITFPFKDIYDSSISLLYQSGIINGKSETEFCPFDLLTREEFAKILSRAMEALELDRDASLHNYADMSDISDWAAEDVNIVTNAGLMQGKDDGKFNPQDTLTKEEMIVTLLRLSQI